MIIGVASEPYVLQVVLTSSQFVSGKCELFPALGVASEPYVLQVVLTSSQFVSGKCERSTKHAQYLFWRP